MDASFGLKKIRLKYIIVEVGDGVHSRLVELVCFMI